MGEVARLELRLGDRRCAITVCRDLTSSSAVSSAAHALPRKGRAARVSRAACRRVASVTRSRGGPITQTQTCLREQLRCAGHAASMCRCDLRDAVTGRLELEHRALACRQRVERREQLHELRARGRRRCGRVGRDLHERQRSLCVGDTVVERDGVVAVSVGRSGMPPRFVQIAPLIAGMRTCRTRRRVRRRTCRPPRSARSSRRTRDPRSPAAARGAAGGRQCCARAGRGRARNRRVRRFQHDESVCENLVRSRVRS